MIAREIVGRLLEAEDASAGEVARHLGGVVPRLTRPYTLEELRVMSDGGAKHIEANVGVGLWDLIEHDIEWLNDVVSEQIAGSTVALTDIGFAPVGVDGEEVIIKVTGSVTDWLEYHP